MSETKHIEFKPLNRAATKFKIIGDTTYMPEPMDAAVPEMYDKKRSKQVFDKDTVSEDDKVKTKYYFTEDGKKGIPARAFYKAMVRASSYLFEIKDKGMRNVIEGVTVEGNILPLGYSREAIRVDWGRDSGMKRSPRKIVRNEFFDWSTEITVVYNSDHLSAEQIFHILTWAGFYIGVGAFRKEKSGNCGTFTVVPA
jgi:hypothetical protein